MRIKINRLVFKCWIEYDKNNGFQFYHHDKIMRILTKSIMGLHIELFNKYKILIHITNK